MKQSNGNQTSPAAEQEQANAADWNIPRPETIPPPTYWPFVLSLGATLMGLGVLTSHVIGAAGTVIFLIAIIKWIGALSSEDRRQEE